jgi:HPt (histidine-containing phosphotransfer) domain-containing protein
MLKELVDLFCETAPRTVADINRSLKDSKQLAAHAHTLKSMGLNLGAKRVVEISRQLEEMACNGRLDGADKIAAQLQPVLEQTQAELRRVSVN